MKAQQNWLTDCAVNDKPEEGVAQNDPPHAENTHSIQRCDCTGWYRTVHYFAGVANYWEADKKFDQKTWKTQTKYN